MERGRPSASAQQVALVRAHLTWRGVLDDAPAASMLGSPWREIERALRLPLLSRAGRRPVFGYLAARTRFYDEAIRSGLDAGVGQVVILGAGFDSRAWRLSVPGVRFFEVDHPATQAVKRSRAPVPCSCPWTSSARTSRTRSPGPGTEAIARACSSPRACSST